MKRLLMIGAVVFTALTSSAVSMIGGGKISSGQSHFVMDVPNEFRYTKNPTEELKELMLEGPVVVIPDEGVKPQKILVREFAVHLPNLVQAPVQEVEQFFESNGWTPWDPTEPDCRRAYLKVSINAVTYIATWGRGQGVVLAGPRTPQVRDAIARMADTLRINEGACGWE